MFTDRISKMCMARSSRGNLFQFAIYTHTRAHSRVAHNPQSAHILSEICAVCEARTTTHMCHVVDSAHCPVKTHLIHYYGQAANDCVLLYFPFWRCSLPCRVLLITLNCKVTWPFKCVIVCQTVASNATPNATSGLAERDAQKTASAYGHKKKYSLKSLIYTYATVCINVVLFRCGCSGAWFHLVI